MGRGLLPSLAVRISGVSSHVKSQHVKTKKQTKKKPYCTKTSSHCILQIPYQNAWWIFFFPYWKVRGSQYLSSCLEYNLIVKMYGNSLLWGDMGHTCGERVGMRRESIFQTQCHCGRWWGCHPNVKEQLEWAAKSLKKIPSVKHRAPWKQPFQLVPDWFEIQIKRSFQTMLKDNLLSIQISPTVSFAPLLCKVALSSLTVQVSQSTHH